MSRVYLNDDWKFTPKYSDDFLKAENEKIIKLKELEIEEKKLEQKAKNTKLKVKITLILGVVGSLMLMTGNWFIGYMSIIGAFYIWLFS